MKREKRPRLSFTLREWELIHSSLKLRESQSRARLFPVIADELQAIASTISACALHPPRF
jgi:hypothetical protein